MDIMASSERGCQGEQGLSIVMAEKVLALAGAVGAASQWGEIGLGRPSGRVTSYTPLQRILAVLAGLACGLRGIASGNTWLRTSSALRERLGGRFPDQGTIHRWLAQAVPAQADALRRHLHRLVKDQGRFRDVLRSGKRLFVDVDAQGLVARGKRFEGAVWGKLGEGLDHGYQRLTAYAGATREVLDEFLRPGTATLLSDLPELVAGLSEVFERPERSRVVIRGDAHSGTVVNIQATQREGFSYLFRMQSRKGIERLIRERCGADGERFTTSDSHGTLRRLECWNVPEWTIRKHPGCEIQTRAVVYREVVGNETFWLVLLTDLDDLTAEELWKSYSERGGTIEEYFDQSERAFHLEVIRTGCLAGLGCVHALLAVCWNLTQWSVEDLTLPPMSSPQADRDRWKPAGRLDLSGLLERASLSGLRLFRPPKEKRLEVEDTVGSAESRAWLRWLGGNIQIRLHLNA